MNSDYETCLSIGDYIAWSGGETTCDKNTLVKGAAVDSRRVNAGEVFFALKGESEDGEAYVDSAFEKGASFAFVCKDYKGEDKRLIRVADTLDALVSIAKSYKALLNVKTIGITGSVGKTSTKNLCYSMATSSFKTHKSPGNYNSITGLCMSILGAPKDVELLVLELGVDTIGEMHGLADIARPDIAIITNVGESHLERFGSRRAIFEEKIGICEYFTEKSALVLPVDGDFLDSFESNDFKVERVGCAPHENMADYLIERVEFGINGTEFSILIDGEVERFFTPLIGAHFALDAALCIAALSNLGLSTALAKTALMTSEAEPMRFELKKINGVSIINDAYNSSLTSLKASLATAAKIAPHRLIAVIGDILESGIDPAGEHAKIGKEITGLGADFVFFYGKLMKIASDNYEGAAAHISDFDTLCSEVIGFIKTGDTLLIKASRSIALENLERRILEQDPEKTKSNLDALADMERI